MFFAVELLFILILGFLFFMIYKNERAQVRGRRSHAVIEGCWNGKERRAHARFKRALNVVYVLQKKPNLRNNVKTVDISEGGVKLLMDEKLCKGVVMNVRLEIPGTKKVIEIEGEVVWSEEVKCKDNPNKRFFHAGIMFSAIKEPEAKAYINYMRAISADPIV